MLITIEETKKGEIDGDINYFLNEILKKTYKEKAKPIWFPNAHKVMVLIE